jgi:hypothetical protein
MHLGGPARDPAPRRPHPEPEHPDPRTFWLTGDNGRT